MHVTRKQSKETMHRLYPPSNPPSLPPASDQQCQAVPGRFLGRSGQLQLWLLHGVPVSGPAKAAGP